MAKEIGSGGGIRGVWEKARFWVAIVILAGVGAWMALRHKAAVDARVSGEAYYYDMGAGRIFTAPGGQVLPIAAPGDKGKQGSSGVLAHVFSCTDCGDRGTHFTAWLETYDGVVVKGLSETKAAGQPTAMLITLLHEEQPEGVLVADPEKPGEWVSMQSKAGAMVMQKANARCMTQAARECQP